MEKFESKDVPGTPGTRAPAFDVPLSLGCSGAIVRLVRGFDGSAPPSERKNEVNSYQTFFMTLFRFVMAMEILRVTVLMLT